MLRPTAKELLRNSIFDKIRVSENEVPFGHKILIDIDQNSFKQLYDNEEKSTMKEKNEFIQHIKVSIVKEYIKLQNDQENYEIREVSKE